MIKIKSRLAVLTAFIMIFGVLSSGCSLIKRTPEAIAKEKLARVGDEYIIRAELDDMMVPVKAQIAVQNGGESYLTTENGRQQVVEQSKILLSSMVEQRLMERKAKELNLFKDEKEIEDAIAKRLEEIKSGYKTEEEFNKMLEDSKISAELLNKLLRSQVISDKVYEDMVKDVTVTDDEIKNYYEANKQYIKEKQDTMELSRIIVATEDEAKDIKARLDKGEDFAELARQYSTEATAKETGGSLGEVSGDDVRVNPAVLSAAAALGEGQVSSPIQVESVYHIIKVTKKNTYPPMEFEKVKDMIKEQLTSDAKDSKYSETMAKWKEEAKVQIYEDKLK